MNRYALLLIFAIAGSMAVSPAPAQSSYPDDSPPMIAGRLAVADGDVQIWRMEEESDGAWDAAQVNDVVSVGSGLHLGANSRTEIRVGPNAFRLAGGSRGGFTQLDYGQTVFNLEYGVMNVRLQRPGNGETFAVTAAGIRVDLAAPGRYRIEADDRTGLRLTTFSGQGTVVTSSNSINVGGGQALVAAPGLASLNFEPATSTSFDDWALARDDRYRNVQSARYVSPNMTGYEELDQHGDWVVDASYGAVWYPRAVPVGWAPYRNGQWRWVRPWGWTWVDYAPWGYAPFHYGRWVTIGNRWGWWPGGYIARPVWAPALVGFVGSGVSVTVGFGGPVVGWYPLAPWHRYRPHYRHGNTYVTVINHNIINQPPRGVPPNVNQRGGTMVPGPRFRDPVMKVALPTKSEKLAELQPIAPPPRTIAPKAAVDGMVRRPQPVQATAPSSGAQTPAPMAPPAKRVVPPMAADPAPNRGASPQPALPGNDPAPLAQPPGYKRVEPKPQPSGRPEPQPGMVSPPQPRAHLPSDQLPPGQKPKVSPAEPARFPPDAPPTIKQPTVPPPRAAPAPVASPAPRAAPPATAQPAPRAAPPAMAQPAPRAAPPATAQPAPRAAPPAQAQPAPRAAPPVMAQPAPRAAPPAQAQPAPRAAPPAQAQPAPRAAPPAMAQPAPRAAPPAQQAAPPPQRSEPQQRGPKQDVLRNAPDNERGRPVSEAPRIKQAMR
jgi:hypothetical protein